MKILVLYHLDTLRQRKTVHDHLYCFRDYAKDAEVHYCNIFLSVPYYLRLVQYDAIIFHYTLLSMRWSAEIWEPLVRALAIFKSSSAIKIAMPQDEYAHTDALCQLFRDCSMDTVYTCAYPIDYQTLYPQDKTGLKYYFTTYTGFVDENTLKKIAQMKVERDIDIGYRTRDVPFWLGHFGTWKGAIARAFDKWANKTSLKFDISTDPKDVILGNDWMRFLLRCRTMLGCLGGASMIDRDGSIRKKVDAYIATHPNATFDEVKEYFFADKDNTLHLFALSPRHFECAMARTCQILLEGDYQGILEPDLHYIELKKDFSNIEEVLKKVEDRTLCEAMAERAYEKVVTSGQYTYAAFARTVVDNIRSRRTASTSFFYPLVTFILQVREFNFPLHFFLFRIARFHIMRLPKLLHALGFAP